MTKTTSLGEAIAEHVTPGASVYVAGFSHLIGFAAAHEIARQRIEGLTLVRLTPDVVYEQLVAAGCAERLVFAYLGNPGVGSLHAIKRAIERGAVEWVEYTHGALIAAMRAAASGASFVPVRALGTTDLARHNPEVRFVTCPYTGVETAVLPPLHLDVAIVHVQRADTEGNAQVWGAAGDLAEAAFAARRVIVTAEEIVPSEVIRADPDRTLIPGFAVDAVVHEPWGAHPSFAQGLYARDNRFYRQWAETSADEVSLASYLDEWIYGVAGRAEYAERLRPRLAELAAVGDGWSGAVNYGDNATLAAAQG